MKKTSFILAAGIFIFFILIITYTSAQTIWAPIGAKWVNEETLLEHGQHYLITFESVRDSIYLGKSCKLIQKITLCHDKNLIPCSTKKDTSIFFLYSVNDKVYYSAGDSFILLYDFSLKIGDTFTVYQLSKYYSDSFTTNRYIIDSLNYIQISGKSLKRQYIHSVDKITWTSKYFKYFFYNGYIIEKVGNYQFMFGTYFEPNDDWYPPFLKCYSDNDIFYQDTNFVNCNGFEGVSDAGKTLEFQLYPNPASSEIVLNYSGRKPYNLQIVNSLGIIIKEQNNQLTDINSINLESLDRGIYLIILKTDNSRFVKKIIKN